MIDEGQTSASVLADLAKNNCIASHQRSAIEELILKYRTLSNHMKEKLEKHGLELEREQARFQDIEVINFYNFVFVT